MIKKKKKNPVRPLEAPEAALEVTSQHLPLICSYCHIPLLMAASRQPCLEKLGGLSWVIYQVRCLHSGLEPSSSVTQARGLSFFFF